MVFLLLLLCAVAFVCAGETFSQERAMAEAAKILRLMGDANPSTEELEQMAHLVLETGMTAEGLAKEHDLDVPFGENGEFPTEAELRAAGLEPLEDGASLDDEL
jgi:hypothetical protein